MRSLFMRPEGAQRVPRSTWWLLSIWLLIAMWCAQVVVTAAFLYYIHVNCGAPGADYGVAFGCQLGA